MARKLNAKQTKILKTRTETHWDELPWQVRQELEQLNDYEVIHHDVSRFLGDQAIKKQGTW